MQVDQIGFHHIGISFYRVSWPKHVSFRKRKNMNVNLNFDSLNDNLYFIIIRPFELICRHSYINIQDY
jgi:hypothetical protein